MSVQDEVLRWFATGSVGESSKAMACFLTTGICNRAHPYDPADFDRCLRLLADAPSLRALLPNMASVSPTWARLVSRWDEIEASHLAEVGLGWSKALSAPKTYALMKEVLRE